MAGTSSRVKALLERTHGTKATRSGDLPSDSAPMPPSPEPMLSPKTVGHRVDFLPNFNSLLTSLRPVSPEEKEEGPLKHNRSASLSTPRGRGRRPRSSKLDGLISAYLKSKQTIDRDLQALDSASTSLLSYLSLSLRDQLASSSSIRKYEDDFKTTAKEVLVAVKTEAVAMDRKCEDLKRENGELRLKLARIAGTDDGKDAMGVVRTHASRKHPVITAFPDVVKRLRDVADVEGDEGESLEGKVRRAVDRGDDGEFYKELSVCLCKQILLERNLCIKPGEVNRGAEG